VVQKVLCPRFNAPGFFGVRYQKGRYCKTPHKNAGNIAALLFLFRANFLFLGLAPFLILRSYNSAKIGLFPLLKNILSGKAPSALPGLFRLPDYFYAVEMDFLNNK
jgi:hypothetical protein